jgi:hypothetical protein
MSCRAAASNLRFDGNDAPHRKTTRFEQRFQASILDVILFRVILTEMSIDPNLCFLICARTGFEPQPVFSREIPFTAAACGRRFVTEHTQQ